VFATKGKKMAKNAIFGGVKSRSLDSAQSDIIAGSDDKSYLRDH